MKNKIKEKINLERTIINLKVEKEEDLYSKFDITNNTISDDVINYIENRISAIPIYNLLTIEIEANATIDIDKFKKAYSNYIEEKTYEKNKIQKLNNVRKIRLFVVGLLFIILSVMLSTKLNTIITTVFSTIGSFSIWEVADSILIRNKEIKIDKLNVKRKELCEIKLKK